jgi:AmmeMemoRadiSam system protein A
MRLMVFALLLALGAGVFPGLTPIPGWAGEGSMNLSSAEKTRLFQVARESIQAHLRGERPPVLKDIPAKLKEPRGVFVTLHRRGSLRGCIGCLEPVKPLIDAVQEMAVAAAFSDPRFGPLRPEELADLDIEISVLTPFKRVEKIEEIEVGRHGLYLEQGYCRGLLLPQVATEWKWDRLTFLAQTSSKAGLPPDAWRDPATRIYIFSAEILSEPPPQTGGVAKE